MNKYELISAAANKCGHQQKVVKQCLDAVLCIVSEELSKGGDVKILEFGRLFNWEKKARNVKIPSGKVVEVPAKNVVRFKAYSHFNNYSTKY